MIQVFVHGILEVFQRADCSFVVERQKLHQQNAADATLRVNPELGVIDTGPAQAALTARL